LEDIAIVKEFKIFLNNNWNFLFSTWHKPWSEHNRIQ